MESDLGLLILRVVVGLIIAGHGAQKLFGWFGGPGLAGVKGWLASMGLRPAGFWALMAGLSEFGGGLLMALGLLSPLGELAVFAAMSTAIITAHAGKGLWAANGGSELPLTNAAAALAVALTGPGAYALDPRLGIALLRPHTLGIGLVIVLVAIAVVLLSQRTQSAPAGRTG
jgi:putative oxidoreductase